MSKKRARSKAMAAAGKGDEQLLEAEEADFETSKGVKIINSFDGLKLRDDLLRGIYAYGKRKEPSTFRRAQGALRRACARLLP